MLAVVLRATQRRRVFSPQLCQMHCQLRGGSIRLCVMKHVMWGMYIAVVRVAANITCWPR
jgi:hypothetical protein